MMNEFDQVHASTPDEKSDQTSAVCELPPWLSTGMGAVSMLSTTADPAAYVWRDTTMPRPRSYVKHTIRIVYERGPNLPANVLNRTEDLMPEGITHRDFAAWAGTMMGGDISDMLDV